MATELAKVAAKPEEEKLEEVKLEKPGFTVILSTNRAGEVKKMVVAHTGKQRLQEQEKKPWQPFNP